MRKTLFAGLTALDAGESLATDGSAFTDRDRDIIDHFLEVGARSHRHDAHLALGNPAQAAALTINASGGALPASTTVTICYTRIDAQGGETLPSPYASVTTAAPILAPTQSMSAAVETTAGTLTAGTYYYVFTFLDAAGGETTGSDPLAVVRAAGAASAQIRLTGLDVMLTSTPGAAKYRIYRAKGQQDTFDLLFEGATSEFLDTGSVMVNCGVHPPADNTTRSTNTVNVVVPSAGVAGASTWRLYATITGSFINPSLFGSNGRLIAEAGTTIPISVYAVAEGAPPDVTNAVAGASVVLAADMTDINTNWIGVGSGGAAAAFENSWVNATASAGYAPMRYRKELRTVFIDGTATGGTAGQPVFTLPVGMRPTYTKTFQRRGYTGAVATTDAYVLVNTSGTVVSMHGTNVRCHFDEISFRID